MEGGGPRPKEDEMVEPNYDLLKAVDDLLERAKKLREEIQERQNECPYAKNHKYMPNGYCEWCGEHYRGD